MKIIDPTNPIVISVILSERNQGDNEPLPFHCPVCGKIAFEYSGDQKIKALIPGDHGLKKRKIIKCQGKYRDRKTGKGKNCNARFIIE